jgi:hypothetical protein
MINRWKLLTRQKRFELLTVPRMTMNGGPYQAPCFCPQLSRPVQKAHSIRHHLSDASVGPLSESFEDGSFGFDSGACVAASGFAGGTGSGATR